MLKEYLNQKIKDNKEKIEKLNRDISDTQLRISESEKVAAVLKKETSMNADIFSPRTNRVQNKEKLAQILEEIEALKKELVSKKKMMETFQQKKREYAEMLEESQHALGKDISKKEEYTDLKQLTLQEKVSIEKENRIAEKAETTNEERIISERQSENETLVSPLDSRINSSESSVDESDNVQNEERISENENVSHETFHGDIDDVKRERCQAGTRIANEIKRFQQRQKSSFQEKIHEPEFIELGEERVERNQSAEKNINMEVKSGELIILESERKKEKEFLNEIYLKVERSLAMLNGNKNMCKKEMQQIKKMIYNYVQSIS